MTKKVLAALFFVVAVAAQAVEVRQVFREERFTRGNVNLRRVQAADDADWIWIADAGPAKGEMDAVRFSKEFVCGAPELEIDVSADERFVLFLDGRPIWLIGLSFDSQTRHLVDYAACRFDDFRT